MKRTSVTRGYTIIELLVSTGIIILMLAISLPGFNNFQRQQQLKMAAEQVRDVIIEAQHYALAPRSAQDTGVGKPSGADFYRTTFIRNNNRYEISEQSPDASGQLTSDADIALFGTLIKSGQLPNGVTFCKFSDPRLVVGLNETTGSIPSKGLIFAISKSGRLVKPSQIGQYRIVLAHQGIRDLRKSVEVQAETGRVTINDTVEGCT